jgi:hypothetical protein
VHEPLARDHVQRRGSCDGEIWWGSRRSLSCGIAQEQMGEIGRIGCEIWVSSIDFYKVEFILEALMMVLIVRNKLMSTVIVN